MPCNGYDKQHLSSYILDFIIWDRESIGAEWSWQRAHCRTITSLTNHWSVNKRQERWCPMKPDIATGVFFFSSSADDGDLAVPGDLCVERGRNFPLPLGGRATRAVAWRSRSSALAVAVGEHRFSPTVGFHRFLTGGEITLCFPYRIIALEQR